jgi:ribosomal protein S18 acetylase RimI-like enzyme
MTAGSGRPPGHVHLRRPTEADYGPIVSVVDEWWGGRQMHPLLPRLWFQHFTGTSWVAEAADGQVVGFLVGFVSPDHPDEAYIHMVASDPAIRRRGVGRTLCERFCDDVRGRGVQRVKAITWPGNRASVGFHTAMGFEASSGPGTRLMEGTPAYPGYDYELEDRVAFVREI